MDITHYTPELVTAYMVSCHLQSQRCIGPPVLDASPVSKQAVAATEKALKA